MGLIEWNKVLKWITRLDQEPKGKYDPAIPLLGIYPDKTMIWKEHVSLWIAN